MGIQTRGGQLPPTPPRPGGVQASNRKSGPQLGSCGPDHPGQGNMYHLARLWMTYVGAWGPTFQNGATSTQPWVNVKSNDILQVRKTHFSNPASVYHLTKIYDNADQPDPGSQKNYVWLKLYREKIWWFCLFLGYGKVFLFRNVNIMCVRNYFGHYLRFELVTRGFSILCSTNWAIPAIFLCVIWTHTFDLWWG